MRNMGRIPGGRVYFAGNENIIHDEIACPINLEWRHMTSAATVANRLSIA
jgi:hypothetical protein